MKITVDHRHHTHITQPDYVNFVDPSYARHVTMAQQIDAAAEEERETLGRKE